MKLEECRFAISIPRVLDLGLQKPLSQGRATNYWAGQAYPALWLELPYMQLQFM